MRATMLVIKANGTEEVSFLDWAAGILPDLQKAVGGFIEQVPRFSVYRVEGVPMTCVAFCDEEGKLKDLPINKKATLLWREQCRTTDVLVGDVVILYGDDEFMAAL